MFAGMPEQIHHGYVRSQTTKRGRRKLAGFFAEHWLPCRFAWQRHPVILRILRWQSPADPLWHVAAYDTGWHVFVTDSRRPDGATVVPRRHFVGCSLTKTVHHHFWKEDAHGDR